MITDKKIILVLAVLLTLGTVAVLMFVTETGIGESSNTSRSSYENREPSEIISGGTFDSETGSYKPLFLDAENCPPGVAVTYFGFGSTTFVADGITNDHCVFRYGTEIENPNWDGTLTHECKIPTTLTVRLNVRAGGVNFSPISEYCELT